MYLNMRSIYRAQEGMRLKKDPPKGYKYTASGDLVPVGWSEFHEEGGENYLNLAKLDSILETNYGGSLPFEDFRSAVRTVEAGPDSPDPYRQRQEVEVERNGETFVLPVGVGRGAYQFDYPTAQTAYNRLIAIGEKRGMGVPELSDDDLKDVSTLDPEIQDMLFTAHFAKEPSTSVKKVLEDKSNWADQWQIGHYKGEEDRRDHFRSVQK